MYEFFWWVGIIVVSVLVLVVLYKLWSGLSWYLAMRYIHIPAWRMEHEDYILYKKTGIRHYNGQPVKED